MSEAQLEKQRSRENEAVARAVRKFQEKLKQSPGNSETGWAMLHQHWSRLADAIRKEQTSLVEKRKMEYDGHLFLYLDADSLAMITLQCIISEHGSDFANGEEIAEEQEEKIAEEEPRNELDDDAIERALEVRKEGKKQTALAKEIAQRCQYECDVMSGEN